jgi:hypothetical protein
LINTINKNYPQRSLTKGTSFIEIAATQPLSSFLHLLGIAILLTKLYLGHPKNNFNTSLLWIMKEAVSWSHLKNDFNQEEL